MGGKLFSQLSEPFLGLMDAPLQQPPPQIATLQMLTSFFSLVLDVTLICAWPQSDSRGRNLHCGDKPQQFPCIYLFMHSYKRMSKGKENHPKQK